MPGVNELCDTGARLVASLKRQERQSTPLRRMTVPSAIWILILVNLTRLWSKTRVRKGDYGLWILTRRPDNKESCDV